MASRQPMQGNGGHWCSKQIPWEFYSFLCFIEKSFTLLSKKKETIEKEKKKQAATWDLAREIVLNLYKIVLTSLDFIPLYVLTVALWYKTWLSSNSPAL